MREVYRKLYGDTDIYSGFPIQDWPEDNHGWNDHFPHPIPCDAKLIVEVGSWKGASALRLADFYREAEIVCIDTWLGSREMWTDHNDPTRYQSLHLRHGYPQVHAQWMSNMVRSGLAGRVTPMPMPSEIALPLLKEWGFQPDMIYIDADHTYGAVRRDIVNALALEPRCICGDDYQSGWPGVIQAVDELLPTAQKEGVFWWL